MAILGNLFHQDVGQLGIGLRPEVDNLVVTFIGGDETHIQVHVDFVNTSISFLNQGLLLSRDNHITQVEGQTAFESHTESHAHDIIQELGCNSVAKFSQDITDDFSQILLSHQFVDEAETLRNHLVEDDTSHGSVGQHHIAVALKVNTTFDASVQMHFLLIESNQHFFRSVELSTLSHYRFFGS